MFWRACATSETERPPLETDTGTAMVNGAESRHFLTMSTKVRSADMR
jgi:hypothetical protein